MVYAGPIVYDWPAIEVKALVMGGDRDGPNSTALARRAADTIPGAKLVLFPDVGHNPHFEAPERFHEALLGLLRSS